jgi:hypothetical protein
MTDGKEREVTREALYNQVWGEALADPGCQRRTAIAINPELVARQS